MKKILLSLFLAFFCLGAYSLETQADALFGGFYNYSVSSGSMLCQKEVGYDYINYDGNYRAAFRGGGALVGFDIFFNSSPLGVYFRSGFLGIKGVERTAGEEHAELENNGFDLNTSIDLGGVYALNFNDYVSLCAAPAVSITLISSEYHDLKSIYSSRAAIDSYFGVGATADLYLKLRVKYFVAAAGCSASYYPFTMVTSTDTAFSYSLNIDNTSAYNVRPYISIGFTLRENTGSSISPAN